MLLYIRPYQNAAWRIAYSFLTLPLMLWFRWLSLVTPSSKTFINFTALSDSDLQACWLTAQTDLATAPFPTTDMGAPMHAPDARALTVQPANVAVIACPDEPIANLVKIDAAWAKDQNPSGAILTLENGIDYAPCHAVTMCWKRPRVYAAASQLPAVLVYEFQNIILDRLGYDISQR